MRTAAEWMPLVYDHLRRLADRSLRDDASRASLQPTALVHEAYLRLASSVGFSDRERFLAAASRALREVIVDRARRRRAEKRGGGWRRVSLSHPDLAATPRGLDVLDLDAALTGLAAENERPARVVELRVFGGLTVPEVARVLEVSPRTIDVDWRFARAWLDRRLRPELDP